jgi:hypothetical protein
MTKQTLVALSILASTLSPSQMLAQPLACGVPWVKKNGDPINPMNNSNRATLVIDESTFPPELLGQLHEALNTALLDWNSSCETPPAANDYPIFSKTTAPYSPEPTIGVKSCMSSSKVVSVPANRAMTVPPTSVFT